MVARHGGQNPARLRQLLRQLFDVTTQMNMTVQEKIDTMLNLQAQILIQNKDIVSTMRR